MEAVVNQIRWGAVQRLEFIEFRVFWEGGINRSEITAKFGVSTPQASSDLSHYRKLSPGNLRYDSSEKRYVATAEFSPIFLRPNADRYLAQLRGIADDVITLDDTWIVSAPSAGVVPVLSRRVNVDFFKRLITVIRNERSIEIHYQSMNPDHPDPIWRRISPHAFGHDGQRWHIRAFCHRDSTFKDFILSRCTDLRNESVPGARAADDVNWMSFYDVSLIPNPMLTASQRSTIAFDYGMTDGRLVVPVRRSLLYYFEKRLRLDVASSTDSPQESPLILESPEEFRLAMRTRS